MALEVICINKDSCKIEDLIFMSNCFPWVGLYPCKVSRSYPS